MWEVNRMFPARLHYLVQPLAMQAFSVFGKSGVRSDTNAPLRATSFVKD